MIDFQDIKYSYLREYNSGVKCKLFYAPEEFFFTTPLPKPSESLESEIIITSEILLRNDKKLSYIDILIDENELKNILSGNAGRRKLRTNLNIYILGFTPSVLGFIERGRNIPFVFFIQDASGQNWQIGHNRNRAFLETAEAGTGKKYEDISGAAIGINCNSPVYLYNHSINHLAEPGDFNSDFNNDFFKNKLSP